MKLRLKCGLTFFGLSALFLIEGAGLFSGCLDVVVRIAVSDDFGSYAVHGIFKPALFQFAFPYDDDIPAFGLQLAPDFLVALLIPRHFGCPEFSVGLGDSVVLTPLMAMPEASVDKDNGAVLGENDVRGARKAFIIHTITKTKSP